MQFVNLGALFQNTRCETLAKTEEMKECATKVSSGSMEVAKRHTKYQNCHSREHKKRFKGSSHARMDIPWKAKKPRWLCSMGKSREYLIHKRSNRMHWQEGHRIFVKFNNNSPLQTTVVEEAVTELGNGDNGKNTEPIGEQSLCGTSAPEARRTQLL